MRFRRRYLIHVLLLVVVIAVAVLGSRAIQRPSPVDPPAAEESVVEGPPVLAVDSPAPVQAAARMLSTGDTRAGIAALEALVGNPDPAVDAAARLVLGEALVQSGDTERAGATLADLIERYPESDEAASAWYFRARAAQASGATDEALDSYARAAERNPDVAAYIRLREVGALRAAGRLDDAARLAAAIGQEPLIPRARVEALERLRAIQDIQKDTAGYLATTEALLTIATVPDYQAQLAVEAGSAAQSLGQDGAARDYFRSVVNDHPDTPSAARALDALQDLGAGDVGAAREGLIRYHAGQYGAAIDALDRAVAENDADDVSWYYRALSRLELGDDLAAADELRRLPARFPGSTLAPPAAFRAGQIFESYGRYAEAQAAYRVVAGGYPAADEAGDAAFRIPLLDVALGRLDDAARGFSDLTQNAPDDPRGWLWLGKVRAMQGDEDGARDAWTRAVEVGPDTSSGLRARELLNGNADARVRESTDLPLDAPTVPVPAGAAARLDALPAFGRIIGPLRLGMVTEAGWEIDALEGEQRDDPALLLALAARLSAAGEADLAFQVADSLSAGDGALTPELRDLRDRLRYPLPYRDILDANAARTGVDPLLFAALVRQESGFNPRARSSADARGLGQVVPSTGQAIADALGRSDWSPDDLYRPVVAIEFGMIYLRDQLAAYDGRVMLALAAYNAGPGSVEEWLAQPGAGDPDVFAELIPYPETADYVRRVYGNYLEYRRIYAGADA